GSSCAKAADGIARTAPAAVNITRRAVIDIAVPLSMQFWRGTPAHQPSRGAPSEGLPSDFNAGSRGEPASGTSCARSVRRHKFDPQRVAILVVRRITRITQ